jgi:thymidylate synthase (FAD)
MNELLEVIEQEATLKKENLNRKIECLDKGFVRLVDFMGTDSSIVQAARVSYGKGTTKRSQDKELIRYLMRHRHTSPFEMVEFKFHCKMPIFCARQWVRHRTASLNEYSGRYSEMPEECYVPDFSRIQTQDTTNYQASSGEQIEQATYVQGLMKEEQAKAFDNYRDYLDCGTAREIARVDLPLSTYTQWYWKMDLHNLFHFLGLRMHPHAQWEMQKYAEAIFELIKPIVPLSCEAFEDYVMGAARFSSRELEILKNLSKPEQIKGLNKREKTEFLKKLGWDV